MARRFEVVINPERCKGCELCVPACPCDVLAMSGGMNPSGYQVAAAVRPEACTGCRCCADMCPDAAIEIRVEETD